MKEENTIDLIKYGWYNKKTGKVYAICDTEEEAKNCILGTADDPEDIVFSTFENKTMFHSSTQNPKLEKYY